MNHFEVYLSEDLMKHEVPDLRESVGWERRDKDFPLLFERCLFWVSVKNETKKLVAFGYISGPGIEHGYLEDIIVHPEYQRMDIGKRLVKKLLKKAEEKGISIITVTFQEKHKEFYLSCGFKPCSGGVWRRE